MTMESGCEFGVALPLPNGHGSVAKIASEDGKMRIACTPQKWGQKSVPIFEASLDWEYLVFCEA
jgi:hypothetical protein